MPYFYFTRNKRINIPYDPEIFIHYEEMIPGIITLGDDYVSMISETFKTGDFLKGMIFDAAGNLFLRRSFKVLQEFLLSDGKYFYSQRFAPRCPSILLEAQKMIFFEILQAEREGLRSGLG